MSLAEQLPIIPEVTLGDRIRIARRHAGLQQQQLADLLEVGVKNVSNWEAGVARPRDLLGAAKRIAEATGVDEGWLLGFRWNPDLDEPIGGLHLVRS